MTSLINQATIGGKLHTFVGYVNQFEMGTFNIDDTWGTTIRDAWIAQFGNANKYNNPDSFSAYVIFPTAFETLTGNASASKYRARILSFQGVNQVNSSNGDSQITFFVNKTGGNGSYPFMLINDFSMSWAGFANSARTGAVNFASAGWLDNAQYTGAQFPRNFYWVTNGGSGRVQQENLKTERTFTTGSPALSCSIATPGANSSKVVLTDSVSPFNYIGNAHGLIRMPSSCVIGKIYKNTGIDPVSGVSEAGTNYNNWVCVGTWGTDKIGLRIWTENIT